MFEVTYYDEKNTDKDQFIVEVCYFFSWYLSQKDALRSVYNLVAGDIKTESDCLFCVICLQTAHSSINMKNC